ncbi:MAG: chemotaxis protein CheW [Cyanobacteria bacterium J06623_7]
MSKPSPVAKIQANLQELFESKARSGDAYVKFEIVPEFSALLSMSQVQKSLIVEAEKITPLPSMPEAVIGIMSSAERVFCVFDLAQMLSLTSSLVYAQKYQIILLKSVAPPSFYIGFAIANFRGVSRIVNQQIRRLEPQMFPTSMTNFIEGIVEIDDELIPVLGFEQILSYLTTK